MTGYVFENARLFDGVSAETRDGVFVHVADGVIVEVADRPIAAANAERIDCSGRTLMPGMIDCHVHIYAASLDPTRVTQSPRSWYALYASKFMRHILDCGFTTVRDVAGGDIGMKLALDDGFLAGPRYYYGGRALSQTGGHGDLRAPHVHADPAGVETCACAHGGSWLSHVVDGVDACIAATREELRKGASHIKIMASGGVASPADELQNLQFSDAEIRAVVEECARQGKYVAAHCHPDAAIRRCTELGVRTIEHGSMISAETAALVARTGNYIVPTLAPLAALLEQGARGQISAFSVAKLKEVGTQAMTSLQHMRDAGCKLGFGTDLLADAHTRQGTEFGVRREVFSNVEILKQATSLSAEVLRVDHQLGRVREGYLADLLVVDGNPLRDLDLLAANGARLTHIMKAGLFHKRA